MESTLFIESSGPQGHRRTTADVELSVVMPCLNEATTLPFCIASARNAFQEHGIAGEVIVADNGSTDGSQALAARLGARVVSISVKGYGAALQGGIAAARGRFVLVGDSDGSYDFGEMPRFLAKLREGYDLVMGNRFRGEIKPGAMPLSHRYLGNPVLSFIGRLFFNAPCGDFHCGIRAFSKDAIATLRLVSPGMEFASEMVVKSTLYRQRIVEVPATLSPDGRGRSPHLRTWRDGWRHLRFLLLYSPRWLFFYPGIALMLTGLAIQAFLLPGPRPVGPVTLDVHTLLYGGAMILVGFQAISFAVFSQVFAITRGLLPPSPGHESLFRVVTLETGLTVGSLLFAGGLAGSLYSVRSWIGMGLGAYDPVEAMRVVIPSAVLLALGTQVVLSSFFLSLLGMGSR